MVMLKPSSGFVVPPPVPPTVLKGLRNNRGAVLTTLVNRFDWTHGCELGLWQGRTIAQLLAACPKLEMIGVDLWEPQPENDGPEAYTGWDHQQHENRCRSNVRRYGYRARIYKERTTDAARHIPDKSLDFVFVDADHSERGCRADILAWLPKIKDTGWITGHDISWPGVKKAVDDLVPGYEIAPDVVWLRPVNPTPGWADELKGPL